MMENATTLHFGKESTSLREEARCTSTLRLLLERAATRETIE